ncbi:MAG: penicillin-binding protein, partial [Aeromicrobium sp.]|nr:penicillin-binding protein [Aeromicrobium sp.]
MVDDGAVPGPPTGVDGHLAAQRKRVKTKAGSRTRSSGGSDRFKAFLTKIGGDGPWWSKTLRWVAFLGVTGTVSLALLFFILYKSISIPTANAAFQTQTTNVYYSDGKHKIGSFSTQDRESVPIDKVPASMQAAAIAAEDRTFYTNRGIDLKGIIRAARSNATSGSIQAGGSTITQQYVKILYLNQERSYTRKVKEAILSIKIHNQFTKKQILEGYLNTIYFGNGSYGVEVASQTYFNKPSSELTIPESAVLASILNSPSFYDPYAEGGKDRLVGRYDYVLNGMAKAGAISAADEAKYHGKLPSFAKLRDSNTYAGTKGYLLSTVKSQMKALEFTPEQIDGGGLKIVTTFDYKKQGDAAAAVKAIRPPGFKDVHTSLVSIQPGTGAVRAMIGGADYLKDFNNWALLGSQPGSSFKAFAVVAALENGYSLKTKLDGNSPITLDNGDKVENEGDSGGQSFGSVPLSKATAKSINTAFVDLTEQMTDGPAKIKQAAGDAGIPESILKNYPEVPVTSLGVERVPTIDMANAYATFAANGKRAKWYIIQSVTGPNLDAPYKHKNATEQTIPKDVVADVTADLRGVVTGGTGISARTICPTAGKTGTATAGTVTNQHVSSSWFVGYTPKLATAVMNNRGKGSGQLDGYLPNFFGGYYPA